MSRPNTILLEGFMSFDEVVNYLVVFCNHDPNGDFAKVRDAWRVKHEYANQQLPTTYPYRARPDLLVDISDSDLSAQLHDLEEQARIFRPFRDLPCAIKLVRIDCLVPLQYQINLEHIDALSRLISPKMTMRELVHFCIDLRGEPDPFLRQQQFITDQRGAGSAIFTTKSEDLRLRSVEYRNVHVHEKDGRPLTEAKAKAVVLIFGHGDPFVSAFSIRQQVSPSDGAAQARQLIVLNNGLHRAFALKRAGHTHIPCVVGDLGQGMDPRDLFNYGSRTGYLNLIRPPVVKDFLDSRLISLIRVPSRRSMLRLNWSSESLPIFD